ncbi:four-carbon acid sugar kinase family protein [Microbacterium sp. P5_E9]
MTAEARTLAARLSHAQPSRPVDQADLETAVARGPRVVILDDDPTGTQSVRRLPIITQWEPADAAWAFGCQDAGFCVLTNTRSLDEEHARLRNAEAIRAVHAAAVGERYSVISRGDSTLRGHHVAEIDSVSRELSAVGWGDVDAVLVVPAFPAAGRITVDAVHWIEEGGEFVPAGASSFALDPTFGYRASDIRKWTEERSNGAVRARDVGSIGLEVVRGAHEGLVEAIMRAADGRHVVVDAVDDNDLRCISMAALEAERLGRKLLYRTSPGLLLSRLGQRQEGAVVRQELADVVRAAEPQTPHGLVVVGSHVPLSSRQLDHVLANDQDIVHLIVDVPALLDPGAAENELERIVEQASSALGHCDVVISTSRVRIDGSNGAASLDIARTVSAGIVLLTRRLLERCRPSFLIGKGGITSSDLATGAVGLRRARIVGSLLAGSVSVWQSADSAAVDVFETPYAVFPGNVGSDGSLAQAIAAFRRASNETG